MSNLDFLLPERVQVGAKGTDSVRDEAILHLAHATINLSHVAPQLSELATSRQTDAEQQAANVHDIADTLRNMSATLGDTVHQLTVSTSEISELTELIQRIANETRMIAINAGIAAAHAAGEHGNVFSLLAKEIRTLSDNTANATKDVKAKIERLQESTARTAVAFGVEDEDLRNKTEELDESNPGLTWLLERMNQVDDSASRQASEAGQLSGLGMHLRDLSEEMIRSVGKFRLEVHERVEGILQQFRSNEELTSHDTRWKTSALRQIVRQYPFIELAYVTNTDGVQVTENIFRADMQAAYGESGKHRNWSQKPWFHGAMETSGVYLSEIYRSDATDEFCLTASATIHDGNNIVGIIAIDVNFSEILDESGFMN